MEKVLQENCVAGESIDAKELFGKFALDAIATSGFGIDLNSFQDPENAFRIHALTLTRDPRYASGWEIPKAILMLAAPILSKALGVTLIDKKATNFFTGIVRQTIKHRR